MKGKNDENRKKKIKKMNCTTLSEAAPDFLIEMLLKQRTQHTRVEPWRFVRMVVLPSPKAGSPFLRLSHCFAISSPVPELSLKY